MSARVGRVMAFAAPPNRVWKLMKLTALGALIFGPLCLGSYFFHLVTGQADFANRTLPWSKPE